MCRLCVRPELRTHAPPQEFVRVFRTKKEIKKVLTWSLGIFIRDLLARNGGKGVEEALRRGHEAGPSLISDAHNRALARVEILTSLSIIDEL